MSYRPATASDVGAVCRFRLSKDKAWQSGRLDQVRDGVPVVLPKYGSARRPAWENVEVVK